MKKNNVFLFAGIVVAMSIFIGVVVVQIPTTSYIENGYNAQLHEMHFSQPTPIAFTKTIGNTTKVFSMNVGVWSPQLLDDVTGQEEPYGMDIEIASASQAQQQFIDELNNSSADGLRYGTTVLFQPHFPALRFDRECGSEGSITPLPDGDHIILAFRYDCNKEVLQTPISIYETSTGKFAPVTDGKNVFLLKEKRKQ